MRNATPRQSVHQSMEGSVSSLATIAGPASWRATTDDQATDALS
jgi:hypothetical protein